MIAQVAELNDGQFSLEEIFCQIINSELGKIASDNPTRLFICGQSVGITFCLFKGRQKFAVGLQNFFGEVDAETFMFDYDFGFGNVSVNVPAVNGLLKLNQKIGAFDFKDVT